METIARQNAFSKFSKNDLRNQCQAAEWRPDRWDHRENLGNGSCVPLHRCFRNPSGDLSHLIISLLVRQNCAQRYNTSRKELHSKSRNAHSTLWMPTEAAAKGTKSTSRSIYMKFHNRLNISSCTNALARPRSRSPSSRHPPINIKRTSACLPRRATGAPSWP